MHLSQRLTREHMVSSFTFSNHEVLFHLACPHESNPSPRSSQCRAPPWRAHINQYHRPNLVCVMRPHGPSPQINSIAPIQSRAPMARPHNSIPLPISNQCCTPMLCPHKSIPSLRSSHSLYAVLMSADLRLQWLAQPPSNTKLSRICQ